MTNPSAVCQRTGEINVDWTAQGSWETVMDSKNEQGRHTSGKDEAQARRDFLKKVGKTTATAPAVALLLAASAKSASAVPASGGSGSS